jgi:hypothetical protein
MARINLQDTVAWKNWQDGQVMTAELYKQERELFAVAINDIEDKVDENRENSEYLMIMQLMEVL